MKNEERSSRFRELSEIGSRIANLRQSRGMTQSQLAGGDITRNMLSRIENGAALPSLPTLCAIAERLCVPVGALLGDIAEYTEWQLARHMKKLLSQKRYGRIIEQLAISDIRDSELARILAEAYIGLAEEKYTEGKLTASLECLDLAQACFCDDNTARRIFLMRTLISACPALYPDDYPTSLREQSDYLEKTVFMGSDTSVYLLAVSKLGNLPKSAYSQPLPEAEGLKRELKPLIGGISNEISHGPQQFERF